LSLKQIIKLEEDKNIIGSYVGRFSSATLSQQDRQYKDTLTKYITCLNDEIKQNTEKLCKLQIRNLIHNEMVVIFEKLSYITSTNEKVKQELSAECKENQQQQKENNLQTLITDALLKTSLHEVTAIYPEQIGLMYKNFRTLQNNKFSNGANLFLEHYVNVPPIKQQYTVLRQSQEEMRCIGVTTFTQFQNFISSFPSDQIQTFFSGPITYGMRISFA
jgi:hypothetical protein